MRKEYDFLLGFLEGIRLDNNKLKDVDHFFWSALPCVAEACSGMLAELHDLPQQPSDSAYYDIGVQCGFYAVSNPDHPTPDCFARNGQQGVRALKSVCPKGSLKSLFAYETADDADNDDGPSP